jgi:hypothetical protein
MSAAVLVDIRCTPVSGPRAGQAEFAPRLLYQRVLCELLHTSLSAKLLSSGGGFWIEAPYFLAQRGHVTMKRQISRESFRYSGTGPTNEAQGEYHERKIYLGCRSTL